MVDLQTAFYLGALVYMGLMTLFMLAIVAAALVVASKLKRAKRKLDRAKQLAKKGEYFYKFGKYFVRGRQSN